MSGTCASSVFSSALAELDGSLQAIQSQLDRLRAALAVDADQMSHILTNTCQHATRVRELIEAERPDADWNDMEDLHQLVHELEIAAESRHNQQQRTKLLDLANELDAGKVEHRFAPRTRALNTLRLKAVQELRTEAALPEQVKDLPGPAASEWLHWACNLQDEKDALVLASLSKDFGAVERFTCEMEESYWIPGRRAYESPRPPAEPSARPAGDRGMPVGGETHLSSPLQMEPPASPEPAVLATGGQSRVDPSPKPADNALPSFGEPVSKKRYVAGWAAAAIIVVLGATLAGIYYLRATTSSKPGEAVATPDAKVAGVVQDSNVQVERAAAKKEATGQNAPELPQTDAKLTTPQLNKQPVEGAQHKILLSLDLCARTNTEGIECSGYVSNLGEESSQVTLDSVDVVDGKGNAFSLGSNGQFDFSTGRSSNIPAGSRAKYTVKIPDKDREARSLTLYLDLRDPRGLEYTFRDVPVAN